MDENIEEWIQIYLRGEGNNIPLADGLLLEKRRYYGPVFYDINKLKRCCGPEESMRYKTSEEDFNKRVNGIISRINSGWDMPPLLVNYDNNELTINDGNHRYESYKRMGKPIIPVIFWATRISEFDDFLEKGNLKKIR